jgi:hypothetical protein
VSTVPDSEFLELRAILAGVPDLDPPADLARRWHHVLAQLPLPPSTAQPNRSELTPAQQAPARFPGRVMLGRSDARWPGRDASAPSASRTGRTAFGAAVLAAAAAVALAFLPGAVVPALDPSPDARPLSLSRGQLAGAAAGASGRGLVELSDPARLAGCLTRVGAPGSVVLGARPVLLDGQPGVLLVLPTSTPGRLRALVVTPDCGADAGKALADTPTGR